MRRQQGIGLPELLVGFFLSTLLMTIMMQHVLHANQQSRMIFAVMEESFELQWLSDFIRSRVRSAGFTPCLRIDHLVGFDARVKPESLAAIEVNMAPDTRLIIHRMSDQGMPILRQISPNELLIGTQAVRVGRPVLIADCYHAEVHDVARVMKHDEGYVVTLNEPLVFHYASLAYLGEWVSESFFIRALADGSRALFYQLYRVDQLTARVHDFSAELKGVHAYTQVHLAFSLNDHRTWNLDTVVRAR